MRSWLHVAMVRHEGEKMSKSLGNLVMIRDLSQEYSPDAIRIYLAMHHYREPWEHSWYELFEAKALDIEIKKALAAKSHVGKMTNPFPFERMFERAMKDDLDTPGAMNVLQDLAAQISADSQAQNDVSQAQKKLRELGSVLGLLMDQPQPPQDVLKGWDSHLQKFAETKKDLQTKETPSKIP